MIVLVHARFILPGPTGHFIADTFFFPGAMGVDLFFIVSGFIMALTTKSSDGSAAYVRTFAIKRVARIWPLYLCVSLLTLLLPPDAGWLSNWAHIKGFIRSLLLIPVNPDAGLYLGMPVNVSWTLTFEVYFYAVLAVSMFFGRWRWIAAACWFAVTLVWYPVHSGHYSLDPFGQQPIHWLNFANVAINPIVWDFIAGLLGGALYLSGARLPSTAAMQWSYLIILLSIAAILMKAVMGSPSPHGMTGFGAPLAALFLGIVLLAKTKEIGAPKWALWLGDISYSLYLTHLFGFRLSGLLVSSLHIEDATKAAMCNFFGSIAFGVVTGAIFYSMVEKPFSRFAQTKMLSLFAGGRTAEADLAHVPPGAARP
ncbi:hypothetical protein AKI39_16835 [Bordetella sp. H567]|nr:hypothetical protein AKI39_16835 [Bordetella sp. H567]